MQTARVTSRAEGRAPARHLRYDSAPLLNHSADPDRVLRIGHVSPECHTALPAFSDPVIAAHDRKRFAVFCHINNPQRPEKLRELGVADTHRVLRGLDDEQVARLIHDDRIDILIDIAMGRALDGVFVATHRRVWEAIRFDEQCFDGFHLYDIDFAHRAHMAGFRLAVPLDLLLIHSRRYASLHVRLQHLEQVERLHTALLHHRFGAFESVKTPMAEHCRDPNQPRGLQGQRAGRRLDAADQRSGPSA